MAFFGSSQINPNIDGTRLQSATNYAVGTKLVTFQVYMVREVVARYGMWHLDELREEIFTKVVEGCKPRLNYGISDDVPISVSYIPKEKE